MASGIIWTPEERTIQPRTAPRVSDVGRAADLTGAFVANQAGRLVDLTRRSIGAQTYSGATAGVGRLGTAMSVAGAAGNGMSMPTGCVSMQSQVFSRIAIIQWAGAGSSSISDTHTIGDGGAQWRVESDGTMYLIKANTALIGSSAAGLVVAGKPQVVGITYDGTNTTFYVDGVAYSGGSSATTFTLAGMFIGCGNQALEGFAGLIFAHFDWPMALPPAVMRVFTGSPWQLLEADNDPVFYSLGGGGAAVLEGSLAASGTVSGALSTAIKVAASVSASASVTAALSTGIRPAASVSASATVSAALTTAIQMAGSLSATASVAGDISGAAALASSVSTSAIVTGDLTTAIRLNASVSGAATVTGILAEPGAAAALEASIAASATVSASLTGGSSSIWTPASASSGTWTPASAASGTWTSA